MSDDREVWDRRSRRRWEMLLSEVPDHIPPYDLRKDMIGMVFCPTCGADGRAEITYRYDGRVGEVEMVEPVYGCLCHHHVKDALLYRYEYDKAAREAFHYVYTDDEYVDEGDPDHDDAFHADEPGTANREAA